MRREVVDDWSPRITQSQQLRDLVVGLAGSIVTGVTDILVAPEIALRLHEVEMRVSAGNNQRENGKLKFRILTFRTRSTSAAPLIRVLCGWVGRCLGQ